MGTLRLADFLRDGARYHVARVKLLPSHRMQPHTHDFVEVFWIEQGSGVHLINGQQRPLGPGDLVLLRPEDVHTFRAREQTGLTLINVAFDRGTLDFLHERYFSDGAWPWAGADLPAAYEFDRVDTGQLGEFAGLLFTGPANQLVLDRFLLALLHRLVMPRFRPGLPLWLSEALGRFEEQPAARARGAPALAQLAGRSREHVNRVARQTTGRTTTQLLQEIRLERAATDLRLTDSPISRIAIECGIPNLSHFYRLFNARFGITPRRYRLRQHALVRGNAGPPKTEGSSAGRVAPSR